MTGTVLTAVFFAGALLVAAAGPMLLPAWANMPGFDQILLALAGGNGVVVVVLIAKSLRSESRQHELTMNLETANIKLTQLDKLKSEFLSFASHQIKAPMSVVKGYATLILDGSFGPIASQISDVAQKIQSSADRMIKLVDTFLDLRRLEEGRMKYEFEQVELVELLQSVTQELRQIATPKGLKLVFEPAPGVWHIRADAQHFRQVLTNLIENSIKYTEHGSVTVALSAGQANTVRISVTDTGRGISPELLPKLFEQFSRDQSIAREVAGTGLGLYISKQIVAAHKGKIWAESGGPGKGSTFIVEIERSKSVL